MGKCQLYDVKGPKSNTAVENNLLSESCFQKIYFRHWSLNAWKISPDFMDHKLEIQNRKVEESCAFHSTFI